MSHCDATNLGKHVWSSAFRLLEFGSLRYCWQTPSAPEARSRFAEFASSIA